MSPLPQTPLVTVDIIIRLPDERIVLIERKNPPPGWAIPGGFVDIGETVEAAAIREAKEETGLDVTLVRQFHVYSDPKRDSRFHTVSIVFEATAVGTPHAADDAKKVGAFTKAEALALPLAFDHRTILQDFFGT
jgi:8-oxo-dGTP diphosphatase